MGTLFRLFAEKFGWTPRQVGDLTLGQALMLLRTYGETSNPEIITMSFAEARASGVKGLI